jgi:ribosomal-protein-alanine N-acetyltransferase
MGEAGTTKATVRVRLERPSMRRAVAFLDAVQRSRTLHHPWVQPPSTLERYRAYLQRQRRPTQLAYLVCTENGALAGVVNVSEIVLGLFRSACLGYYAFAPYDRRGYMRAGLASVIGLAFGQHRLHRLEANIQPGNAASIALVRGLGFRREGYSIRYLKIARRWRDHERWALLKEDWQLHRVRGARR